eukprot:CAMPEP_0170198638 /NCGR_PEP_ID=MMETSP0040_2-20121228/68887_1 /TAXON_ID=641309 /ORGANISM="Lotharella oceanica, Strain CCMP622" /LENGTH=228 /DNA_ID=CAMNT_0010448659 /DNA_START=28 /DNA_END=714 /DNA_ORIENTATION=+
MPSSLSMFVTMIAAMGGMASAFDSSSLQYYSSNTTNDTVCWKDSYGRGVGKPIHTCQDDFEKSGALCYPKCRTDVTPTYYGVGPVCWQHCKEGYIDEGALCRHKDEIKTYAKSSYGRGAGKPLTCADDEDEDAGLCYTPCKGGYYGVGPVCWESCGGKDPEDGGAICCRNADYCTDKIKSLCAGVPLAVAKAILAGDDPSKIAKAAEDAIDAVLGFIMPLCKDVKLNV